MDAQVSYAFHSERKLHPEKFKSQFVNQVLPFLIMLDKKNGCLWLKFGFGPPLLNIWYSKLFVGVLYILFEILE